MDRSPGALPRVDLPVEKIVKKHAAHIEGRHGKANQRDVEQGCCGVGDRGPGKNIGPHGRQIGYAAKPQQSLGTGCSQGDNIHPTSSCWQNAISRAMSADLEPVRSLSGSTSHVYVSTSR